MRDRKKKNALHSEGSPRVLFKPCQVARSAPAKRMFWAHREIELLYAICCRNTLRKLSAVVFLVRLVHPCVTTKGRHTGRINKR